MTQEEASNSAESFDEAQERNANQAQQNKENDLEEKKLELQQHGSSYNSTNKTLTNSY